MRRISLLFSLALSTMTVFSCSDNFDYKAYYNEVLVKLSSEENFGRSNYNDGDIKAAKIIMDYAMMINDLQPLGDCNAEHFSVEPPYKSLVNPSDEGRWGRQKDAEAYLPYLQHFCFPMNVFRGDMAMSVDGKPLRATYDFTAKEFSPSQHGTFGVKYVPDNMVTDKTLVPYLNSGEFKDCYAVISFTRYCELPAHKFERYKPYIGKLDPEKIAGVIFQDEELFQYFKARSYYNTPVPVFMVTKDFPKDAKEISVDIDAEMIPSQDAHNIIAYLPGTDRSKEEYITFIAHYDHLGLMGRDNLFPGANDNASGAAMLLSLAEFFSKNRPEIGIQFIWLDAEEENLLGAFYYCANPVMPLGRIKYVINLDMVADSGDHLATECSKEGQAGVSLFKEINASNGDYAPFDIAVQDYSDNSDHYAFGESGVPAVYFSTEGDYLQYYHSPRDYYDLSTDENFDRLFSMIIRFVNEYPNR